MSDCPAIYIRDLKLAYGGHVIFEGLDLDIEAGRFTTLLGTSGVGKSSLLKIVAGLQAPTGGTIAASDGKPISHRIAYMGQQDLLFPWLSVVENVMLGSRLRGDRRDPDRAMHMLEQVGLADRRDALPSQLSGGMRQRTAIARTLYESRPIVLMDEPFSALDTFTRSKVQELAAETLAERTVLLITHDPLEACRLGHRLFVLSGSPAKLSPPISVPGCPPRSPEDLGLLETQAELMGTLLDAHTAAD
ncbi:ABC transporter ATP-binding protein [Methyloligella sp. GL2]|nr:ABC transporter ATP-binding protein [Methyloligella sp. GL2]